MTQSEAQNIVSEIPVGAMVKLLKTDGSEMTAKLGSQEVRATEKKDYGDVEVPSLPPSVVLESTGHIGNTRIPVDQVKSIELD
jgi:hypothetical protein